MIKSQEFKTDEGLLNEHENYLMMYLISTYYNKYALKINQQCMRERYPASPCFFIYLLFFNTFKLKDNLLIFRSVSSPEINKWLKSTDRVDIRPALPYLIHGPPP